MQEYLSLLTSPNSGQVRKGAIAHIDIYIRFERMRYNSNSQLTIFLIYLVSIRNAFCFTTRPISVESKSCTSLSMSHFTPCELNAHPSSLPGDPSLILVTNVDLGDKKLDIMKACSKAIEAATGKPEAYIGVSVSDKADVIFGGSADPCALGNLYSIGAISMESNGAIHSAISDLLSPHGVDASRMYINYFDMDRANVGWNRKTFAG